MKGNFYENPIKLIIVGREGVFPNYILVCWILITGFLFFGNYYNIFSFSYFAVGDFLGYCITGLSFTLALFVATRNVFTVEELGTLIKHKKGELFYNLLAPFQFTSLLFLILGIISMVAQFLTIKITKNVFEIFAIVFISMFILALLSLFNLTNMTFNNIFHTAKRSIPEETE